MSSDLGQETNPRVGDLRRALRRYVERYGRLSGMVDVEKANSAMAFRQRRLDRLLEEEARIRSEIAAMTSEITRIERWVEFCLEDAIERVRREKSEGWSPRPVLGFRLWWIGDGALNGVKAPWISRKMTAVCLTSGGEFEIPHSDGRCGRLGCGVYAAKSIGPLYRDFDVKSIKDFALGLVAMTGKVVEHDDGYRAAEATVVALAATLRGHMLLTGNSSRIEEVFEYPDLIEAAAVVADEEQRLHEMETYIGNEARSQGEWT
jgi:hypothetical protein